MHPHDSHAPKPSDDHTAATSGMTDAEVLHYAENLGFIREPTVPFDGETLKETYAHFEAADADEAREFLAAGCRYPWQVDAGS